MTGDNRERWKFVKQPMLEQKYLFHAAGAIIIVYAIYVAMMTIVLGVVAFHGPWQTIVGQTSLAGFLFLLGWALINRQPPPRTRYHKLIRSGTPATAKIFSKDRDSWSSSWGAWEEHLMTLDLATPNGKQSIWSKVDADTYFHADAGQTCEVILDFEHHRWTWKPSATSSSAGKVAGH